MRPAERGFLLLSSCLGNPDRKPLTTAQLRTLADRAWQLNTDQMQRELTAADLTALGFGHQMASRILQLLSEEELLEHYLRTAGREGCVPLTRVSEAYPLIVRKRLGLDSPGVLWAKGDLQILREPMVALVGSRDIRQENRRFAEEAGRQAALQGFVLVSGNARGADRIAQDACLEAGGKAVVVVADALKEHSARQQVLFLSEEDYDQSFSTLRALSRNRIIHTLGKLTLIAQCSLEKGGTWDGTTKNLRYGWSPVCCCKDGSPASERLQDMGARLVTAQQLSDLEALTDHGFSLFDQ